MDPLPRYYITPEMLAAENCRRGRKRNFCVTEKIQPALNRPLRQRLKRYAKNYGMSETEIVTLALESWLRGAVYREGDADAGGPPADRREIERFPVITHAPPCPAIVGKSEVL